MSIVKIRGFKLCPIILDARKIRQKEGGKGMLAERVGLESEAKSSLGPKVLATSDWGLKLKYRRIFLF